MTARTGRGLSALALIAAAAFAVAAPRSAAAQAGARPGGGDTGVERMAENTDLRIALWESLLIGPKDRAMAFKAEERDNPWSRWRMSVEKSANSFYILFSPVKASSFPAYGQGSWIIKRSQRDGSLEQIKIFLRSDPDTFARIYPFGARARMDIVAYGGVLYREVILPLAIEDILRSPFSRVRELSAGVVDWSLFSPDPALYAEQRQLAAQIRARLPGLRYKDDGAIDADGQAVYISSLLPQAAEAGLNCSGFVKWIVDGMIEPLSGRYLSVDALRERMLDWRGSSFTIKFEESLDPFFGLDWSRALARELWSVMYPSRKQDSPLAHDVSEAPFSLITNDSNPINGGSSYIAYPDNFEDAGFDLRGLKAMLFVLATREPGRYYLAQFNARTINPPRLRSYFHIAALFPYFDHDGSFKVAVFESAAETSLDRILGAKNYEFVKLVRMPVSPRFNPPALISAP
jgi:hypothetical protein